MLVGLAAIDCEPNLHRAAVCRRDGCQVDEEEDEVPVDESPRGSRCPSFHSSFRSYQLETCCSSLSGFSVAANWRLSASSSHAYAAPLVGTIVAGAGLENEEHRRAYGGAEPSSGGHGASSAPRGWSRQFWKVSSSSNFKGSFSAATIAARNATVSAGRRRRT